MSPTYKSGRRAQKDSAAEKNFLGALAALIPVHLSGKSDAEPKTSVRFSNCNYASIGSGEGAARWVSAGSAFRSPPIGGGRSRNILSQRRLRELTHRPSRRARILSASVFGRNQRSAGLLPGCPLTSGLAPPRLDYSPEPSVICPFGPSIICPFGPSVILLDPRLSFRTLGYPFGPSVILLDPRLSSRSLAYSPASHEWPFRSLEWPLLTLF